MILGIGARGQGRMILSILRAIDLNYTVSGYVDRDQSLHGTLVDGVPVLGGHTLLRQEEYHDAGLFLGVGTNPERKVLYDELGRRHRFINAIHPDALVAADVAIGDAPVIMSGVTINQGSHIGTNVILNTGAIVEHDCVVGSHAHICPGAVLCGGVSVGEGAVVGAGATVKDGVTIGAWATVGAGAVVVKDVPAGMTVVGNPAVPLGTSRFKEDGFCIIAGLCDPIPLQRAIREMGEQKVFNGMTGRTINFSAGHVSSVHGIDGGYLAKLLRSELMGRLASAFLGEQATPRAVEFFAKPAQVGLASPWHQDNAYWCLEPPHGLTIWIALDVCTAENGGLTYLAGTHKLGLIPHHASHAPGSSQTVMFVPTCEAVTPALQPGDALIHHCLTVHGSAENKSGRARRGVTLQYQGISATVNQEKLKAYEASLEEQVRGRA